MTLHVESGYFLAAKTGEAGLLNGNVTDGVIAQTETPDGYASADNVVMLDYSLGGKCYYTLMGGKVFRTDSTGTFQLDFTGYRNDNIVAISAATTPEGNKPALLVGYNTTAAEHAVAILYDMSFAHKPAVLTYFWAYNVGENSDANKTCKALHSQHSDTIVIATDGFCRVFTYNTSTQTWNEKSWKYTGTVTAIGVDSSDNVLVVTGTDLKKLNASDGAVLGTLSLGTAGATTNILNSNAGGWKGADNVMACHYRDDKVHFVATNIAGGNPLETRGEITIEPTSRPKWSDGSTLHAVASGNTTYSKYSLNGTTYTPTATPIEIYDAIDFSNGVAQEVVTLTPITTDTTEETHYKGYLIDPVGLGVIGYSETKSGSPMGIIVPFNFKGKPLIGMIAQFEQMWQDYHDYAVGDRVMARELGSHEFVYECTVAGSSGATEPTWGAVVGSTFTDNTVTWETKAKLIKPVANLPETAGTLPPISGGGGE